MEDAATSRHGSRMPRWLGEKIWCWSSTRSGLNRFETEENSIEGLVLYSTSLGEHERWSQEVDLRSQSLRGGGAADLVWDRPPRCSGDCRGGFVVAATAAEED
ncbi:hypothetical protein GW17_00004205 [Ensete ventricosum]|nr:hypothetical protein GW17_00004205 [Ensete ventricosum]